MPRNKKRVVEVNHFKKQLAFPLNEPRNIRRRIRQLIVFSIELGFEFENADQALDMANYLLQNSLNKSGVIDWTLKRRNPFNRNYSQLLTYKTKQHQNVISKFFNLVSRFTNKIKTKWEEAHQSKRLR